MSEAPTPQGPAQARLAIGGGGRLARKALVRRGAVALALILSLGVAKYVVGAREVGPVSLSALPGGRPVTAGLDIGGMPSDSDLQALAASYRVDGVVNLSGPDVAEQAAAASLRQGYLYLAVAPGAVPTWAQLRTLAGFLRSRTSGGRSVYVHDDVGGGRAVVVAGMLLLLRGEAWPAVAHAMTPAERRSLSPGQWRAIKQLISALHSSHRSLLGNPYAGARLTSW